MYNHTDNYILLPAFCVYLPFLPLQSLLKVKPSFCFWSSSNVMRRQSQCSVGSSVSSYLGSSSLNWEPARLRIPIWIIIIRLLQGTVPVSLLHSSLHHSAAERPLGCAARRPIAVHLICSAQSLHLFCIVALVQSSRGSRMCIVCLLSCLALKYNIRGELVTRVWSLPLTSRWNHCLGLAMQYTF